MICAHRSFVRMVLFFKFNPAYFFEHHFQNQSSNQFATPLRISLTLVLCKYVPWSCSRSVGTYLIYVLYTYEMHKEETHLHFDDYYEDGALH